ncbi:MAG: tetratricopeptide repeat protein [Ferruginibacter sp.]
MRKYFSALFFLVSLNIYCVHAQSNMIDSFEHVLQTLREDTSRVKDLLLVSKNLFSLDPEKSLSYAAQAKDLSQKIAYKPGIAYSYKNIGIVNYLQGKLLVAIENFEYALVLFDSLKDKIGSSNMLGNIGAIYYDQGDDTKALDYYLRSLKYAELSGDKLRIATALVNAGNVYSNKDATIDKALEYYRRSLSLTKEINDQYLLGTALVDLGELYMRKNEDDSALDCFKKSVTAYKGNENIAYPLNNIGKIYARRKDFISALKYQQQAYDMSKNYSPKIDITKFLTCLAETYYQQGDKKNALDYYLKAKVMAEEIGAKNELKQTFEGLAKTYVLLGDYVNAFKYQTLFTNIKDTLYNIEQDKKLARLQFDFDIQKKQSEIDLLTKDKAIVEKEKTRAEANAEKQKLSRNSIAAGACVVLLSSLFMFLFYKRKRDAEEKQKETLLSLQVSETEMKALRSQMNPHFIFNALQSIQTFLVNHKSEEANVYLLKFSKLMRLVLENSQYAEVSLKTDMQALELYMQLESIRLQHPFTYEFYIDENVNIEDDNIPPLILQPFVENAIWHGLQYKPEPGKINIYIRKENNSLYASVEDNGVGRQVSKQALHPTLVKKNSLGMKLTEERLKILNEVKKIKAQFQIIDLFAEDAKPAGTRVELSLPLAS